MRRHGTAIGRRRFLRQSAALGLGTFFAPALAPKAWAATRDRW
ncbi:MAG: twin-arginine translocation signal domain-containing protein [Candidatus Binatia bacterium]